MTDIVDGTVVDEPGTELVVTHNQAPAGLFHTNDPVEVVEKAVRVADSLKAVIVAKGLFTMIQGKAHIGVDGWQLLGAMLGVTAVVTHTEKIDDLTWKATVEARDQHGRVVGQADALCSGREKRGPWKNADDYARCSMAQTRATSKALKGPLGFVLSLAGYATTPAEEMTFAEPDVSGAQTPAPTSSRTHGSRPGRDTRPAATPPENDPWVVAATAAIGDLELQTKVRPKLADLGVVPPKQAGLKSVLSRLEKANRDAVDVWLNEERLLRDAADKLNAKEQK
jgi:hypothetical protein